MSYGDAIDALSAGPPPPRTKVLKVTIPEGRARRETAPLVREAGLRRQLPRRVGDAPASFSPRRYGAPRSTRTLEGFLFPATYELEPGASRAHARRQQLDAFEREHREGRHDAARAGAT